jgi:hypothetical protein
MTSPRTGCAARAIFRDKHLAVGSWYTLTTPDGAAYEFCSGCCLLYFAVYGALPADLEQPRHSAPLAEGEAAA